MKIVAAVVLLIIGVLGTGGLFGVGEGFNNAIIAFAAISLLYSLLAGPFSKNG